MPPRTVRTSGLTFACLEEGDGPLVLLLHGFPDTAHTWDRTRPALAAAGFRAVSPFLRGYAPTEIPADGDFGVDALARDVAELIEALGERDAVVVGHDWGAWAALAAANLHPERVRRLVTVAIPHAAAIRPSPALLWKARHFVYLRRAGAAQRIRKDGLKYVDELLRRWSPAWDVPTDEGDAVKRSWAAPGSLEAAVAYYRAVPYRLPANLRGPIAAPTLAFAGATDPFMSAATYVRARRHHRASYDVVTLPGGHFLHREDPDRFNEALISWLRREAE